MPEQRRWTHFIDHFKEHAISRWMFYSLLIGLVAGLGAVVFLYTLEWLKYFVLDYLAGYPMKPPAGEHLVEVHEVTLPGGLFDMMVKLPIRISMFSTGKRSLSIDT